MDKYWIKKGAKLSKAEAKGRFDIKVVTTAGQQVIIELKKGDIKPSFPVLYGQMGKYYETLSKVLAAQLKTVNPSIRVVALVGKRPDDMGQEKQEIALSGINGTIVTYDELIDNSQQAYNQYIEASSKASTLNAILTRITEQIDED